MTVADDLVAQVSRIIQDDSFTDPDILREINNGVSAVAAGPVLANGARLAPLPELFTSGTVDTATDAAKVSLPADYKRGLRMVVSGASGDRVRIEPSFEKFSRDNPKLDETGSEVRRVTIMGRQLYYQPIPTDSITLTLYYYRKPTPMATGDQATQQEPDGLPEHLWFPLLVNYAARNIFEIIDGDDGMLSGTINKHDSAYQKALYDLHRYIGPARVEPWNVGDEDDGGLMWFEEE